MSVSTSRLAYADCADVFERAIEDPKGVRVFIGTYEAAKYFITRMHMCRTIARNENSKTYDEGHPMHGVSVWDKVRCTMKQDEEEKWWVYVEKVELDLSAVESLSELGE